MAFLAKTDMQLKNNFVWIVQIQLLWFVSRSIVVLAFNFILFVNMGWVFTQW